MANDALAAANRRKPEDAPTQPPQIIFLSRGLAENPLSYGIRLFDVELGRGRPRRTEKGANVK